MDPEDSTLEQFNNDIADLCGADWEDSTEDDQSDSNDCHDCHDK